MSKLELVPLEGMGCGTSRDKLDKSGQVGQVGQVRDKWDRFMPGDKPCPCNKIKPSNLFTCRRWGVKQVVNKLSRWGQVGNVLKKIIAQRF